MPASIDDTTNNETDGAVHSSISPNHGNHNQPKIYRLSLLECATWIFSILMYIADYVTDFVVGFSYIIDGHPLWGTMIILLSVTSGIVVQGFSLYWSFGCCWRQSVSDNSDETNNSGQYDTNDSQVDRDVAPVPDYHEPIPDQHGPCFKICHLFGLSMMQRYLYIAIKGRKRHDEYQHGLLLYHIADAGLISTVDVTVDSAPQLILQIYIIITNGEVDFFKIASVAISFLSTAYCVTYHVNTLRKAQKQIGKKVKTLSFEGLGMYFVWRISFLISRLTLLAVFAYYFQQWIFFLFFCHWFVMTTIFWIDGVGSYEKIGCCVLDRKDRLNLCEKFVLCLTNGWIDIFFFINLKQGKTRLRYIAHFFMHLLELILTAVLLDSNNFINGRIAYTSIGVITGGFFVGLVFFIVYYSAFHPNCTSVGKYYTSRNSNNKHGLADESLMECSGSVRQVYFHSDIVDTGIHITSRESAAVSTVSSKTVPTSKVTEMSGDTVDICHTLRFKEEIIHAV
ncbi:uncharacterized protein TRIADDRAFT_58072 [Trichoplax adhaerens]|uniref:XK-related protein n=1 Tax=Trichoplax adhaerens TaxID=10228 RepID=B3S2L9_TRIAD|nr:hypothetical protein TRIADDRAFT_58072 [Trichoplax adhaerens]EDV23119.1 hypothetical protein TRIADDRAFT_58072 [Trichoplax adhaerens]|eukprot:XP_002114029.1 hypothetical protein TRIADDRAFT_58072 [Trichoplax adhaerens]